MRTLPILAAVLFLLLGGLWLAHDAQHDGVYPPGCSLDFTPAGLSQAYGYLARPGGHAVSRLTAPLQQDTVSPEAVVLRIAPVFDPFLEQERTAESGESQPRTRTRGLMTADEDAWVSAGGRLVLAISNDYGPIHVGAQAMGLREEHKVFPALPGVATVTGLRALQGASLASGCTVFAVGNDPALVRMPHGQGEVWVLSNPEAFDNMNLDAQDHLQLLTALTGDRHAVVFDEFSHGVEEENGLLHLLRLAHFGPALVLFMVAFVCWFWRRRVLIGEVSRQSADVSTEAVDGVSAIGALYARMLTRRDALTAHYRRLLRKLQERRHGKLSVAQEECDRLLHGWRPEALTREPSRNSYRSLLRRLNRALRSLAHDHHL
jgi:hypothetical protein